MTSFQIIYFTMLLRELKDDYILLSFTQYIRYE